MAKFEYSNPEEIKFLKDLTNDSFSYLHLDNSFIIFKSINNILYLVYSTEEKSIICYNLINNKKINEIKNAHTSYITLFRHFLDEINKRNVIISLSAFNNNIKLWNIKQWECIYNFENVNNIGFLYSACFFNIKNNNYIFSSNFNFAECEFIKMFDFNGNKINEINDSNEKTYFIDIYYDKYFNKNYIITGNEGYVKSYDYIQNKAYYKYNDKDNNKHYSVIIIEKNKITELIESSYDGTIRIWNFHSGELLKKIQISKDELYGLCLWNNDNLFVGCEDRSIRLIELDTGKIIKNLNGHKNSVITIKKINHPQYGICLISQACEENKIKMWVNNNNINQKLF